MTEASAAPAILFEAVSKRFDDTVVLDNVSFTVQRGEAVCIMGPSGTGKTTLLRLVNALTTPDSGRIRVDRFDVTSPILEKQALRLHVGTVFQRYSLFPHKSALENVSMGQRQVLGRHKAAAEEKARDLLAKLEIDELRDRYPGELSAGQQQRVALARALAMDPQIVLLDEVTAALDPRMVDKVASLLRDLAATGMSFLASSHDGRFVSSLSDKVGYLSHGQLSDLQPPAAEMPTVERAPADSPPAQL
ncbi:MAG: ATP-binding cassette domain-containing protein [Alphaproteobacteria bacterium]|nr:ATP-binding cassette domain-containing protein [Alphaproteobacteria bacterium]MBU0886185.1 ATP-binding cassette domain-containing protein [Alphaproteobacteria bacterium]MBU1812825.1 ATP-binding cassette domain-containing protein [Alphaproteobacteria bacterium]MBU2091068.1 ATP-binding cassette domain-containing protein [Alphaproteobacteria bacterium]